MVVADGVTVVPEPDTGPIPGSMVMEPAPDTLQERVAEVPGAIVEGVAEKEPITGFGKVMGPPPEPDPPPQADRTVKHAATSERSADLRKAILLFGTRRS